MSLIYENIKKFKYGWLKKWPNLKSANFSSSKRTREFIEKTFVTRSHLVSCLSMTRSTWRLVSRLPPPTPRHIPPMSGSADGLAQQREQVNTYCSYTHHHILHSVLVSNYKLVTDFIWTESVKWLLMLWQNAEKNVMANVAFACSQWYTKDSVFWSA